MIVQNCNVELTKVHYYDVNQSGRNLQICTISRDEPRQRPHKNTVIKKNIFGHKWVLNINESSENLKKSKTKVVIYLLVFACLVVAVCCGIVFSVESKFFKGETTSKNGSQMVPSPSVNNTHIDKLKVSVLQNHDYRSLSNKMKENIQLQTNHRAQEEKPKNLTSSGPCSTCRKEEEICLNIAENEKPKCKTIIDGKDPTGCGGLCKVNKEYCKMLDAEALLFQCRPLQTSLNCSSGSFSCGNMCISNKMRCDGFIHCSDHSDEKNCACNLQTHFRCGNSTGCLERSKKCDGNVDCWDNSDESNCIHACSAGEVPCRNGHCIPKENFCDGVYQCSDKSDEPEGCEIKK